MDEQTSPVSESEPVAYQFRQRSAVGKGQQCSLPWCDWVCIEREDYERYVREPNKLVQVRPLYADHAQTPAAPDRDHIARAICCPSGCSYQGDSEDGEKCYCDTSDFHGSGIEKKTDAVLEALSDTSTVCDCEARRTRQLERGRRQPEQNLPDGYPPDTSTLGNSK